MKRADYDKQLLKWARSHYWDSLEKDKYLILRHLRTFAGDENELKVCQCVDQIGYTYCGNCGGIVK